MSTDALAASFAVHAAVALFADRAHAAVGSAIDVRFEAIPHAIAARRRGTCPVGALPAVTISRELAVSVGRTRAAGCTTAIDAGLVLIDDAIAATIHGRWKRAATVAWNHVHADADRK